MTYSRSLLITNKIDMAIKKTNNVKAEFSMSSLTDIIFLLLIFFMLTSSFVTPNALKLVLPKASNAAMAKQTIKLYIDENQNFQLQFDDDLQDVKKEQLEQVLSSRLASFEDYQATIVINSDENVPIKEITNVMSIGNRLRQKVILATRPE